MDAIVFKLHTSSRVGPSLQRRCKTCFSLARAKADRTHVSRKFAGDESFPGTGSMSQDDDAVEAKL